LFRSTGDPRGRLALIDFGLVVPLSGSERKALLSAVLHCRHKHWRALVGDLEDLNLLCFHDDDKGADQINSSNVANSSDGNHGSSRNGSGDNGNGVLRADAGALRAEAAALLEAVLEPYVFQGGGLRSFRAAGDHGTSGGSSSSGGSSGLGPVLWRLGRAATSLPFAVPPNLALVARAVGCLEGVALAADPHHKLILEAYPLFAQRALSDAATAATAAGNAAGTGNAPTAASPRALFELLHAASWADVYTDAHAPHHQAFHAAAHLTTVEPGSSRPANAAENATATTGAATPALPSPAAVARVAALLGRRGGGGGGAARALLEVELDALSDLWVRHHGRATLHAAAQPPTLEAAARWAAATAGATAGAATWGDGRQGLLGGEPEAAALTWLPAALSAAATTAARAGLLPAQLAERRAWAPLRLPALLPAAWLPPEEGPTTGRRASGVGRVLDESLPPLSLAEEVRLHDATALWQHCANSAAGSASPSAPPSFFFGDGGATAARKVEHSAGAPVGATAGNVSTSPADFLAWALRPQAVALLGRNRAEAVAEFAANVTGGKGARGSSRNFLSPHRPLIVATGDDDDDDDDDDARQRVGEMAQRALERAFERARARAARAAAQGLFESFSSALRK
jgi:hypothetical protein